MRRTLAAFALIALPTAALAQPLADDGHSDWAIYHAPDAPPSVQLAAREIQRVVLASTGAGLPIVDVPVAPMICLGDNEAAHAAGVSAEGLPRDGFRLRTVDGSLYICGREFPDDRPEWIGWTSRGTLYGACEFLERVVGARWLMPGEVGEDIPAHATLAVPDLDIEQAPDFEIRVLQDVREELPEWFEDRELVRRWFDTQKLPCKQFDGWALSWGHSWNDYITEETLAEHPEWRAIPANMTERWVPARHSAVKYCTTNPEMIQAFAQGVMARLEENPRRISASISPSDGGAFCTCEDCAPYIDDDPHGWPSYSRLILKFYNDIANIVCARYPDRQLPGYVYYNYMYPPAETIRMHPNVWLVFYGLRYYGWGLAKPTYAAEFRDVVEGWRRFTPNMVYGSYTVWMRSFNGAIIPPPRAILKMELPIAHEAGYRGASMVGIAAWGYGAPINYVFARQMWDADLDVDATLDEWMQRAYGPGWESMRDLYALVEQALTRWKEAETIEYRGYQYEMNYELIDAVHRPIFEEMERLYLDALARAETDAQRARLEMFGDNLVKLHHDMREAGMIEGGEDSYFHRDDAAYEAWLEGQRNSIAIDPRRYPIWHGEWSG